MNDPVNILAEYLTDTKRIVGHSIAAEIGGARNENEAKAFFALRDAFNIGSYADADAAKKAILAKIPKE